MTSFSAARPPSPPDSRAAPALGPASFAALSGTWWDEQGPFGALHHMTPARVTFIKQAVAQGMGRDSLEGLRLLDIGCGGGLLAEPLARLGGTVTGVEPEADSIAVARAHAQEQGLTIDYHVGEAAALPQTPSFLFDVVIASEVVEHVADPALFLAEAGARVRDGGVLVITTLNRTFKSLLLGIVVAERVLRLVPKGLHDWQSFLKPSEVAALLRENGLEVGGLSGLRYNPFSRKARLVPDDLGVNYLLWAKKSP